MDIEILNYLPQLSKIIYKSKTVHLCKLDSSYRKKYACFSRYMLVHKENKSGLFWRLTGDTDLEKRLIELGFRCATYISESELLSPKTIPYGNSHILNKYLSIIEKELA